MSINLAESKIVDISVVIATLGGDSLKSTIEKLNSGTYIPTEILICIPKDVSDRVEIYRSENVHIIKTTMWGQVSQRIVGFQNVKCKYVLQLDDDVEVEKKCLEYLYLSIIDKPFCSIAPSLLDKITGNSSDYMSKPDPNSGLLYKLIFWVINGSNGYQAGKISLAGINMAFNDNAQNNYEVDWMPGGCVLHNKNNLIMQNYYPYKGKAFSEDLFHSVLLKRKGITLFHCPNAICFLDNASSKGGGVFSLIKIFTSVIRITFKFADFANKSKLRLFFFLILNYLRLLMVKLSGKK